MKWTSFVTRSYYWILGKNVDLSGSLLGCARRISPAVACFRGVLCLAEDEHLRKRVISGDSATVRVIPTVHLPRLSSRVKVRVRIVIETETPFDVLFFTPIRVRVRIEPFCLDPNRISHLLLIAANSN